MYPTKKLGEIVKTIRGVTYKPSDVLNVKTGLACFRTKNIQTKLDESDIIYIDKSIVKNEEKFLQDGDLLISSANSLELLGKCCLIENLGYKATLGGFISCFRPLKDFIDYNYFYYFYNSYKTQKTVRIFSKKTTGIANLQIKEVEQIPIPLPPLPTQKLIVQKLDSAFENIDKNINLTKENLKNIEELNKSVLEKVFSEGEYEMKKLGEITSILGDGLHGTPKYIEDGDFFFINGNNLDDGNIVFRDGTKKVNITEYEKYKKILNSQTVFISINGTIGNTSFYNNEKIILGKSVCYFNLNENIDKFYVRYFLKSKYFFDYIDKEYTGTTIKNVSLKSMRNLQIPLPPLPKQKEIVSYLDEVFSKNKELKTKYELQLKQLEELKQSLLKDAFEGRLIP